MLSRIGTLGLSNINQANIQAQQSRIQQLTIQISSGKNARQYQGLARESSQLLNLENELERLAQFDDTVTTVERRASKQEQDVKTIIDLISEFRKQLLSAANDENHTDVPLDVIGRNFYDQVAQLLNTQQDGRHIWGGSDTNTEPVLTFDEVTDEIEDRIDGRAASAVLTALRAIPTAGSTAAAVSNFIDTQMTAFAGGSATEIAAATAAFAASNQADGFTNATAESVLEASIAAAQREIGGIVLFGDNVANDDLIDPDTGLPVRAQQLVDFLTGGSSFGTQGDADSALAGAPDGFLQKFSTNTAIDDALRKFINDPVADATLATQPNYLEWQTSTATFSFSDVYYQGNFESLEARIEDHVEIDYNLTAERTGIEQVLAAAWLIGDNGRTDFSGTGEGVPDVKARIDTALHLIEDALGLSNRDNLPNSDNLTNIRSEVGFTRQRLEDGRERINQFELAAEQTVSSIEDVDLASAATNLANAQLILESSFLTVSSLSKLSLANFLR